MAAELTLNRPLIDWLTLTSFDEAAYRGWRTWSGNSMESRPQKRLQYRGASYSAENGSIFIGRGEQRSTTHYMAMCSGELAQMFGRLFNVNLAPPNATARCTRIDLQVTVEMPTDWSQFELFSRVKSARKNAVCSFVESMGGHERQLDTVYIGSWTSDRKIRVYMKPCKRKTALRLETEYKSDRAGGVARRVLLDGVSPGDFLLHELEKTIGDDMLSELFAPVLSTNSPETIRIVVDSTIEKTERWLLSQVLPAFERTINSHESSGEALSQFHDAIQRKLYTDGANCGGE